jgi:hypothetical protein
MKKLVVLIGLMLSIPLLAQLQMAPPGGMGAMGPMPGGMGRPGAGRQAISPNIVTFKLHNRPASEVFPLLQPFLGGGNLAYDENQQMLLLQCSDEEAQTVKNLLLLLDQPLPRIQTPSFQLSFYFIKCQLNQDPVSEEAVRQTWEKLQETRVPDTTIFKGSLRKAINDFKARGIGVLVRWDVLETEGVSPDDEVKFSYLEGLKDIRLRQALEIIVKAMGPLEAKISYAIDADGMVVISTAGDLPRTNKSNLLPEILIPIGKVLAKNGFGNPQLLAPFIVKSQENGTFKAEGCLAWSPENEELVPLWANVEGHLTRKQDGKTLQLEVQSSLITEQTTPATTRPASACLPSKTMRIFNIKTTTVTSEGDYVILAGTPAGLMPGQAIALVIRVDAEGTSPTLAPKAAIKSTP